MELGADDDSDELVLDNDDVFTSPVMASPVPPPSDEDDEGTVSADDVKPLAANAGAAQGGTLFERMKLYRARVGAGQHRRRTGGPSFRREPLDIPRFLNRQNNK